MSQILILGTRKPVLTCSVSKQQMYDSGFFKWNETKGQDETPGLLSQSFRSVMEALSCGWTLIQVPSKDNSYYNADGTNDGLWGWWLVK